MRKLLPLLLIVIFLGKNNDVLAQIVNIEDKRGALTDTSGWFGYLGLSLNFVKNQKSITSVNGNLRVDFLSGDHRILLITNYNLVSADAEKFIDNGFQHFRYNYQMKPWLTYESFAQAQFNNLARIQFRGLLGTGFRYQILKREKEKVFFGLAYMFEYDEIKIIDDLVTEFRDHRMSSYLSMSIQPASGNFKLSNTSYYQPVLTNFSDVRLSSQTSLQFKISKKLTFTAQFNITNDTRVAEGIPRTYYSFTNGIRWDF